MSYTLTLEPSEFSVTWLPTKPPVCTKANADLKNDRGRRRPRAFGRFPTALCIGIATLLAWQPDSDAAREMIASTSPQLGWVAPPGAPIAQTATNAVAPTAPSPDEQPLRAMSTDLAAMRQSVDELIANQEQMAREITRLQETARYILYKMSEGARAPLPRPAPEHSRPHGPRSAPKATDAGPSAPKATGSGSNAHYPATSSRNAGSSSPAPVLVTHRDAGHMRTRSSAAGLKSSPAEVPFTQALKSAWSRITGIRS